MQTDMTYKDIVASFRKLTSRTYKSTGYCCKRVVNGVPYCCSSLIDGTYELTFTQAELDAMAQIPTLATDGVNLYDKDGVLYAKCENQILFEQSLKDGLIADTLECASHPTRPVIRGDKVVGVVTVKDCIAEYDMDYLVSKSNEFRMLWKQVVKHTGIKPYYITGEYDPGKYILL